MKKIAFFNNKGGCAKSTAAINTAWELSKLGKNVLLIDCDSQRNSFYFFSDGDCPGVTETRYQNIKIVFDGTGDFKPQEEIYDIVIYDMPPSISTITEKILQKSNFVFVPVELGTFSIQGLSAVTNAIANAGTKFCGCFSSRFEWKNPADTELLEILKSSLGDKFMPTRIPMSRVIKNSISFRMTAAEYMPWTIAGKAYNEFTLELLKRIGG